LIVASAVDSNEWEVRGILTITYTWARRCAIALIGGTVVLIGILMIVFPGPAFIVIPAGLAILGLEFACARRWLLQLRTTTTQVLGRTRSWWGTPADKVPADKESGKRNRRDDHNTRPHERRTYPSEGAAVARASDGGLDGRAKASTKTSYYRTP
jgi:tellurite resistance protein TerC